MQPFGGDIRQGLNGARGLRKRLTDFGHKAEIRRDELYALLQRQREIQTVIGRMPGLK